MKVIYFIYTDKHGGQAMVKPLYILVTLGQTKRLHKSINSQYQVVFFR